MPGGDDEQIGDDVDGNDVGRRVRTPTHVRQYPFSHLKYAKIVKILHMVMRHTSLINLEQNYSFHCINWIP